LSRVDQSLSVLCEVDIQEFLAATASEEFVVSLIFSFCSRLLTV
jgi:hypothetical protein